MNGNRGPANPCGLSGPKRERGGEGEERSDPVLRPRGGAGPPRAGAGQGRVGHPPEHIPVLQHQGGRLGRLPRAGRHAGGAGTSPLEPHVLTRFTFVVQVLGIKVETKVQCVGAKCELCLFSLLWAGLVVSFQGRSRGDTPRGSLVPVRGESVRQHRTRACPPHLGAAPRLAATMGAQELESPPGRWVLGGQKDDRRAPKWLGGRPTGCGSAP